MTFVCGDIPVRSLLGFAHEYWQCSCLISLPCGIANTARMVYCGRDRVC